MSKWPQSDGCSCRTVPVEPLEVGQGLDLLHPVVVVRREPVGRVDHEEAPDHRFQLLREVRRVRNLAKHGTHVRSDACVRRNS